MLVNFNIELPLRSDINRKSKSRWAEVAQINGTSKPARFPNAKVHCLIVRVAVILSAPCLRNKRFIISTFCLRCFITVSGNYNIMIKVRARHEINIFINVTIIGNVDLKFTLFKLLRFQVNVSCNVTE